jgi:hypothetical protein
MDTIHVIAEDVGLGDVTGFPDGRTFFVALALWHWPQSLGICIVVVAESGSEGSVGGCLEGGREEPHGEREAAGHRAAPPGAAQMEFDGGRGIPRAKWLR